MNIDNRKVFVAGFTRNSFTLKNNLYDIIQKDVAEPILPKAEVQDTCYDFTQRSNKFYVPKKKSKCKVVTVRDIRSLYEKEILETLPCELENQQTLLLQKIRSGDAKDENTKTMALNLLKSDKPICRSLWQILMNLNPERHPHSSQYILWNGKRIRINGSKGGKNKFLYVYDKCSNKEALRKSTVTKSKNLKKKRGLLRDSLDIRFKPGPLRKKKELDYSYQKNHVGDVKLVNLPKPGFYIQPSYRAALEPTVKNFLQNLREQDGTISEEWAEFAVTMLGKVTNKVVRIENKNFATFNLNYKNNQKLILMRHNFNTLQDMKNDHLSTGIQEPIKDTDESVLKSEVKLVVERILDSVEISLNQDLICPVMDEPREIPRNTSSEILGKIKEKGKRRYGELDRFDVTMIRVSENTEQCRQSFCSLGCICDSLECAYKLKDHCGRVDCMFNCKCDLSRDKITGSSQNECSQLQPDFYLDKKLNEKSKEEQKSHQTVVVTDDKSILLKSSRRNCKSTKKHADFYSSIRLRSDMSLKLFSVVTKKLKCDNIIPWCMVHNLYKCFCKGKFTQNLGCDLSKIEQVNTINNVEMEPLVELIEKESSITKAILIPNEITNEYNFDSVDNVCARVLPYKRRSHSNVYYLSRNKKIVEMEKNDKRLNGKLINLINQSCENEQINENYSSANIVDVANVPFKLDELLFNILVEQQELMTSMNSENKEANLKEKKPREMKQLPNKTKLVEWLESSYKKYRERLEKGIWKTSLTPPKTGKVALYPWDFILSRYLERKNLFLISVEKPNRIFMAVDAKHPFFEGCINVRHISPSDSHEYPVMVRNLIKCAKNLKDTFCILCGLSHCWELIGSVTKVNENQTKITQPDPSVTEEHCKDSVSSPNNKSDLQSITTNLVTSRDSNDHNDTQLSKWFVMTIENDFSEIQFFIKGFFVKYDSILKAIEVSRRVRKTVRLSSQRCNEGSKDPQFGLYATPNMDENSVFIGPYEKDEPLGIETVKNPVEALQKNKTRGLWVTINKKDNPKVIDNPLSFMPSFQEESDSVVNLDTNSEPRLRLEHTPSIQKIDLSDESAGTSSMKTIKPIKPIKIRKTDGFNLLLHTLMKKLPNKCIQPNNKTTETIELPSSGSSLANKILRLNKGAVIPPIKYYDAKTKMFINKPVAEIAPNIKISNIASLCKKTSPSAVSTCNKKREGGMFILKPEEINERLAYNYFHLMQPSEIEEVKTSTVISEIEPKFEDENFLDSPVMSSLPGDDDVCIISDDEEDDNNLSTVSSWRNVCISCTNVKYLGWIPGRRNNENLLSFEFPGFASTDFYEEEEAFNKINQVFSRKVYVPKHITMKWQVIETEEEIKKEDKLKSWNLSADFVLTKRGLIHKNSLISDVENRITLDNSIINETADVESTLMKFKGPTTVNSKEVLPKKGYLNQENLILGVKRKIKEDNTIEEETPRVGSISVESNELKAITVKKVIKRKKAYSN